MNSKFYDPRRLLRRNSSTSFAVTVDTAYRELNRTALSDIQSSSESVSNEDENALKYLTAAMFASVLEDSINSMIILSKCNTALNLKKTFLNMSTLLKQKYDVKPPSKPEDPIRYPLDSDENKIEKMMADRKLCLNMLIDTYEELRVSCTYQRLQRFLREKELQEDNPLSKDVAEKKSQYREMKKKLRSQRHVQRLAKYDSDDFIRRLIDLLADTEQISSIKNKYTSDWKNAQTEQHVQKIDDAQRVAIGKIDQNRCNFDREIRAHYEVQRFNNIIMAEQMDEMDRIMEKYDKDMEVMDLKIQVTMSYLSAMKQKRMDMEDKLEKRQQEMDAWIKFKEDRELKQARIVRYHKSATIVQAWWRGILVRHKLGPFRPARKGRRGKKKRLSRETEAIE